MNSEKELRQIKNFLDKNFLKYLFIWQVFSTTQNKEAVVDYENKKNFYYEQQRIRANKYKNVIAWKLFKGEYSIDAHARYVFEYKGQQRRYSSVEIMDYGFLSLSDKIRNKLGASDNRDETFISEIQKDVLEASFHEASPVPVIQKKRRL